MDRISCERKIFQLKYSISRNFMFDDFCDAAGLLDLGEHAVNHGWLCIGKDVCQVFGHRPLSHCEFSAIADSMKIVHARTSYFNITKISVSGCREHCDTV